MYDVENRLSQVSVTKDGKTAVIQQNIYNGEGQRIQKIDGDETINYYYQDGVVAYTTDTDGNQNSQNLIGTGGNVLATERFQQNATQYYLYNKDIQGSTSSLVKEDGSADAIYQYTDFGETMIQGYDQAKNEVCYTGGIYDQSTGLYYLNARYYDPEDGRFMTEDSYRGEIMNPETGHLYVYCANNPVNYVDPSGHLFGNWDMFGRYWFDKTVFIRYGKGTTEHIARSKKDLNLENTSDKIKFLNEIAKIISSVDNNIEKEVYIENISKTYNISKEAIYAQVNKLTYSNVKSEKILEKTKPVIIHKKQEKAVSEKIKNREDTILSLLLNEENNVYEIIKQNVKPEDFKYEIDKLIAKKLYEEFEKGNSNISSIIDNLTEEEQNHVTAILAEDFEIENTEKAIDDLLKNYEKDKLQERKQEIMELRKQTLGKEEQENLLNELNEIIYKLAKIK